MKLPDFFKFEPLNGLRRRMGIQDDVYGSFPVDIVPVEKGRPGLTDAERKILAGVGIPVNFGEWTILPDRTIAYKDNRVLLYIRDVRIYGDKEWEPRYHLFNCKKLAEMSKNGHSDRYYACNKLNGKFDLNIIRNKIITEEKDRQLSVCQFCLDGLRFNGFNMRRMNRKNRENFVAEFVPDDFFKVYPRSLHTLKPKHDSDSAPLNEYPPDFPEISERLRRENGWKCQKCHRNLSEPRLRQYLHVHHVNGIRSDNTRQNLKIFCIACHAEEPYHSHVRKSPDYAEFSKLSRSDTKPFDHP
jgi:hypothetical protein